MIPAPWRGVCYQRTMSEPSTHNGPFYVVTAAGMGSGHLYPYVCFTCRGCFRRPVPPRGFARPCPRCGATAAPLWTKFKPPRRDNDRQWEKVEALARRGFFFLAVEEPYPDDLKAVPAFAERHADKERNWRARWPDYYRDLSSALDRKPYAG